MDLRQSALPPPVAAPDNRAMDNATPTSITSTGAAGAASPLPAPPVSSPGPVNALEVAHLTKTFGGTRALDDLSVSVPVGQIVALLGQNGAGKTTLLDIALGLQRPDAPGPGDAPVGGARLFGMAPRGAIRRSLVGVVHQTGALLPEYTVRQTLQVFGGMHAHSLPLGQVLEQADLTTLAGRRVGKLSGGEQQRVRLALALLPDPLLLVLDEPTAGMDALARRAFWQLMRAQADAGRTIVFATHYLAEAQDFAQRTIIVKAGRIVADAPTDELRHRNTSSSLRLCLPDEGGAGAHAAGDADRADLERRLRALPGSDDWLIEWPEGAVTIQGSGLDAAARLLLGVPGAHDLEIVPSSLEDVFAELTR